MDNNENLSGDSSLSNPLVFHGDNSLDVTTSPDEAEPPRWLKITLTTLAYGIPLAFLAYVLYINYLPFGFSKTYTINVGTEGDTDSSQPFYLEPSPDLGERKSGLFFNNYRELNGTVTAVFKPDVVLKDAEITVEVEGEGIEIIPPVIDFDPNSVEWDYSWDFTQGKTPEELGLTGNAFPFDGAMYFDGTSRLELPDSADKFEDGPFSVYVEWTPEDSESDFQQIVGHFNWELWQNSDSVEFRIGRTNNATGTFYTIKHLVEPDFFNQKHSALAIYSPAGTINENGYIELYIDDNFIYRVSLQQEIIWKEYGSQNLSSGWSSHNYGNNPKLKGSLLSLRISVNKIITDADKRKMIFDGTDVLFFYLLARKDVANLTSVSMHIYEE